MNQVKDNMRYLRTTSNADVDSTDGCVPKWTEVFLEWPSGFKC